MAAINAGNKGLHNLGNTCYMNSTLQCLSHLLTFHPRQEFFQAQCTGLEDCLMNEWYQFQCEMWSNTDNETINPKQLLEMFQQECSTNNIYFENFDQNDVDEFLHIFLDLLHKDIKRKVIIKFNDKINDDGDKIIVKSFQTWKDFYENDYSYIIHNFHSQLLGLTNCPKCNYCTSSHDPIQVISLEITNYSKSLYDCFQQYTKKIVLDNENSWKCDQCNLSVCPTKKTLLWKTSDILIILLKRYNISRKINTMISYPNILDLNDYSMNYGSKKQSKYSLQAFSIHDGGLQGGHYYAVCKNNLDNQWYQYNDESVRKLSKAEVFNYKPYLFFYKRL